MPLFGKIVSEKVRGDHRGGNQCIPRLGWTDCDENQSDEISSRHTSWRGQSKGRHHPLEELYVGLAAT
jgi:hypothetical protein